MICSGKIRLLLVLVLMQCCALQELRGAERPNIVVILCDDLGWGDLECYGHPAIKTPHLNQLAKEGTRFTRFYSASPVCSPSRTGLMTGRTPNRAGVYDWIPRRSQNAKRYSERSLTQMRASEVTIPEVLRSAGYATCMSGKWHCNSEFNSPNQAQPDDHGFDHWFGTQNNASPSHANPVNFVRNGTAVGRIEGYSCQIAATEAIGWLREQHASKPTQPFFVYLAFHEPHEPIASPATMVAKYEKSGAAMNREQAEYFANVENLDKAVGRVMACLEELGRRDDTLVIFTSDNGPETLRRYKGAGRSYGVPGPLRGMKLHTHEAGSRVAGIMRWPGKVQAGLVSDQPISSLDFLPTFAGLAGASLPDDLVLDGTSLLSYFKGNPITRERPLFWLYYNALNEAKVAMIQDGWKILAQLEDPMRPGQRLGNVQHLNVRNRDRVNGATLMKFELYNVANDIGEARDLAGSEGARLERMKAQLKVRYADVVSSQHVWPLVDKK